MAKFTDALDRWKRVRDEIETTDWLSKRAVLMMELQECLTIMVASIGQATDQEVRELFAIEDEYNEDDGA